ncbi:hypothetical protein CB1_001954013 [Camelus ferus]|nr:hypothetical protein CB1_001954013 [Camelus ferus]
MYVLALGLVRWPGWLRCDGPHETPAQAWPSLQLAAPKEALGKGRGVRYLKEEKGKGPGVIWKEKSPVQGSCSRHHPAWDLAYRKSLGWSYRNGSLAAAIDLGSGRLSATYISSPTSPGPPGVTYSCDTGVQQVVAGQDKSQSQWAECRHTLWVSSLNESSCYGGDRNGVDIQHLTCGDGHQLLFINTPGFQPLAAANVKNRTEEASEVVMDWKELHSTESLLSTPPHRGPTDLKGPFLPGHEVQLCQRAGITAKAE